MTTKAIEPKEIKTNDLDPNHKLLEESTIDEKGKANAFLSKKNIIIAIVAFLVSIIVLVLTFLFILRVNWGSLFKSMGEGFAHNVGYLWFFLLIVMMIFMTTNYWLPMWIRFKEAHIKIPFVDYLVFCLTMSFFKATTPINFVQDPYALYWMRQHGLTVSRATSIWFSNMFFWNVGHLLITIPTVALAFVQTKSLLSGNPWEVTVYILLIVGFVFDILGIGFAVLMATSKWVHYFLSKVFNWFKKKFHKPYHTKEQIAEKYRAKATIKKDFINDLKDWKGSLPIMLMFALCDVLTYASMGWGMLFVQYINGEKISFDFWQAFNFCSAATCANKIAFIIPNGEGTMQAILQVFLNKMGWTSGIPEQHTIVVNNGIMVWRSFSSYFPAILGLGGVITVIVQEIRKRKNKSK